MEKKMINYETLIRITKSIAHSKDPEENILMAVEGITTALDVKGCALFLINRRNNELELAGSFGLSQSYINKGPLSALKSISHDLKEGPVAIYDISDDPRIQYPEEAKKEGISSILSVPVSSGERLIGALRVYTSEPWEFTLEDVNFVQALAQLTSMAIEMNRLYQGQKEVIDILKRMRGRKTTISRRRTPFEGVPVSIPLSEMKRKHETGVFQ